MVKNSRVNSKVDPEEFELPETVFIRDIENRVFQSIVLQSLSKIRGVTSLEEGSFIDHLLGRGSVERVKGIYIEQNSQTHSVSIKVEVNIHYGLSIPEKAAEIQKKIIEEITKLTGLRVSCVHVVFKGMTMDETPANSASQKELEQHPTNSSLWDAFIEKDDELE